MNPQTSSSSISQPLADLAVAASEIPAQRNGLDGGTSEHPRSPSTGDSSDRSHHSPALEGTPAHMLQLSTVVIPSAPTFVAHTCAEFKRFENGNCGVKPEGEGEVEDDRKREREHKKRSKNWTRFETLKLIRARSELDERFRKSGRKGALWDEIAQVLQRASFFRDAQQCKDKWEKLTAGYKEVRDGARDREDHPFYEELHPLLSSKLHRRESGILGVPERMEVEQTRSHAQSQKEMEIPVNRNSPVELPEDQKEDESSPRKRKRDSEFISLTDLTVVQDLLETVINRQQRFFKDLLDAVERKELLREQIRNEREEKWRAEERAQRFAFNNAMMVLTQRLLGERPGGGATTLVAPTVAAPDGLIGPKKRSKNWKRAEVLQLIRFRREMEDKFSKSTRRAALWEELAEKLATQGIKRDGKQCREKWDKLMAEYKDVADGRKDQEESPYFAELTVCLGRSVEGVANVPQETTKEEYVDI